MSENQKTVSNLKSLLTTGKTVEVDYPGMPDFKVKFTFLCRDDLVKIRKSATTTTFKKGALIETLNEELFLTLYAKGAIKGWTGLKLEYLAKLAPVDLAGMDMNDCLEFSDDNARYLMQNSNDFDAYVTDIVGDLSNFQPTSGTK